MFTRGEDGASVMRSSERQAAFLVVIRRAILLATFLFTSFVIATCWSATANADELGADEASQPVYHGLVALVANGTAGPVESGAANRVRELVDVEETFDQVGEIQAVTDLLDVARVNPTDGDLVDLAVLVRGASGGLVTAIDAMAVRGLAPETPSVSLPQAESVSIAVDRVRSLAEVSRPTVTSGSGCGDLVPTGCSGSPRTESDDSAPVGHVHGDNRSGQVPSGIPATPFPNAGTGGGMSAAGLFGGSSSCAVVPGAPRREDSFVVSGVVADGVYPVRQLSAAPQVFPA